MEERRSFSNSRKRFLSNRPAPEVTKAERKITPTILETDPNNWILLSDVDTDYDLGYYYAIECGCIEFGNNEVFERYFDFERYGRDLALSINGNFSSYGFIKQF